MNASAATGCRWQRASAARRLRRCSVPHLSCLAPIRRIEQLEPGPAFELALGVFAGRGVDVALPGLAQEVRLDHQVALRGDLLAALLEEHAADRRFAW